MDVIGIMIFVMVVAAPPRHLHVLHVSGMCMHFGVIFPPSHTAQLQFAMICLRPLVLLVVLLGTLLAVSHRSFGVMRLVEDLIAPPFGRGVFSDTTFTAMKCHGFMLRWNLTSCEVN